MKNITNLLKSATNGELADISGNVSSVLENANITNEYLTKLITELKVLVTAMLNSMSTSNSKELSKAMEEADATRDSLFKAMVSMLKGFLLWNNSTTNDAAKRLYAIVSDKGLGITRLSYEKQSAAFDAIIQACKTDEIAQALSTTSLTNLFTDLEQSQTNFKQLYQQSANLESIKDGIASATEIRPNAFTAFDTLINYVGVMSEVDAETFAEINAQINRMIDDVNEKVRVRITTNKTKTTTVTE